MARRDLYAILGVDRRATQEDIKAAYRRLAREMHPDVRRDDPGATDEFKEINEAYAVLSDPARRAQYDRTGRVGPEMGPLEPSVGPFDDLFEMFFGGRPGEARPDRDGPQRGADLRFDLEVSLQEVMAGAERRISISRQETCPACFGTGAERGSSPQTCPTCQGAGQVRYAQRTLFGHLTQIATCGQCGGSGTYIARPCVHCRGSGQAPAQREVTVTIPAGVEDGMHLRLRGEGEAGMRGGERGDLYVVVHVAPHRVFARRGRDLVCDAEVSMVQAALGDEIRLEAPDGEAVVSVPVGAQPGHVVTLRGRGLPDLRGGRGDLLVTLRVVVPRRLTAEQRALLEEFRRLGGEGRRDAARPAAGRTGERTEPKGRKRAGRTRSLLNKVKDLLQ